MLTQPNVGEGLTWDGNRLASHPGQGSNFLFWGGGNIFTMYMTCNLLCASETRIGSVILGHSSPRIFAWIFMKLSRISVINIALKKNLLQTVWQIIIFLISFCLKIRPFREAHKNRQKDKELLKLTKYLKKIAKLDDFSNLNHKYWERSVDSIMM